MNTPKIQRVQVLTHGSMSAVDSPLRRRSVLNASTAMLPPKTPDILNNTNQTQNDDEAERRTSRRFDNSVSEQESTTNLAEAADSLNNCLKLFAENKINKDNAWSINIIDSFAKLIQKHHSVLSNFQVAGTTLEASAKVYGLRVDSVYTDVCRMSADLARQTAKALSKKSGRPQDDEEESDRDQDNENGNQENLDGTNQPNDQQPKTKKAKKRRNISTVTKNPDTLNAKLDTIPLTDPFFAKLNSVIGDTNSSKRLMQNIIPTEGSKLKLRQNIPMWNSKDQRVLDLNAKIEYSAHRILVDLHNLRIGNISKHFVRQGLSNYVLTNSPMESYEDNDTSFRNKFNDDFENTVLHNQSNHVELQFDINAAVEPVQLERSVVMDFGDMDQEDFEDLNEMDQIAVHRCKGLKRQPIMIEDMQPETAQSLEYSYRPLDMIDQFWAGPSHWKFRQSRRTQMSMGIRASHLANNLTENVGSDRQKPKVARRRKLVKKEATFEDCCNIDDDTSAVVMKITPKMKGTQLSNLTLAKKWDSKKHKLPADFKVPLDIFDKYLYASTININSNPDVTFTAGNDDDDVAPYNYNNDNDRDYCRDMQSDTETETNTDMGQMDNIEFDNAEMPPPPAPIEEIPDVFVGAPERIEKISIAFARRAKVVDMKQLKYCSWSLIKNKHNADPLHNPKFSDTLKELPKVLNRTMAENMSMPLAFYAVLHLCNDKGLLLNQNDETLKDFEIEFVQASI